MALRRPDEPRIFFPWERRGGVGSVLYLGRTRRALLVLAGVLLLVAVGVRERRRTGVRHTQATLLDVRRAVERYMAEHDGACPPALSAVAPHAAFTAVPPDAWGRPLRLACPSSDGTGYELSSDGPDGVPGGVDRIH